MAHRDNTGLTACYHLIDRLETQLRAAHNLRDRLENHATASAESKQIVSGLCRILLDEAVTTAQATAMLRETLCAHALNSAGHGA